MAARIILDPVVTGEPDATETGTSGSGRGPSEKDLHNRYLADGLPVPPPQRGRALTDRPLTAPAGSHRQSAPRTTSRPLHESPSVGSGSAEEPMEQSAGRGPVRRVGDRGVGRRRSAEHAAQVAEGVEADSAVASPRPRRPDAAGREGGDEELLEQVVDGRGPGGRRWGGRRAGSGTRPAP